jgi:hypothetical protein
MSEGHAGSRSSLGSAVEICTGSVERSTLLPSTYRNSRQFEPNSSLTACQAGFMHSIPTEDPANSLDIRNGSVAGFIAVRPTTLVMGC